MRDLVRADEGLAADGLAADGLAADCRAADGRAADGLAADGCGIMKCGLRFESAFAFPAEAFGLPAASRSPAASERLGLGGRLRYLGRAMDDVRRVTVESESALTTDNPPCCASVDSDIKTREAAKITSIIDFCIVLFLFLVNNSRDFERRDIWQSFAIDFTID